MNEKKISFIMCSNNDSLCRECQLYIDNLKIPNGYHTDVIVVKEASSMASGYNFAMGKSDAKYKIYLHQDVFIINCNFISDMLDVFARDPDIGMIGVVGNRSISENGCPWASREGNTRVGKIYADLVDHCDIARYENIDGVYQEVLAVDGLLMATQYDLRWREDLFCGYHFYDLSQSMEFIKAGYKVVVPNQSMPWCLHDNAISDLSDYENYREIFKKEYEDYFGRISK